VPPEATVRALRHVWLTLKPLDIPMAVMGGLALAAWNLLQWARKQGQAPALAEAWASVWPGEPLQE